MRCHNSIQFNSILIYLSANTIVIIITIIHLIYYCLGNSMEPVMGKHSEVNINARFKCTYIHILQKVDKLIILFAFSV
jgi:hypothetical protein